MSDVYKKLAEHLDSLPAGYPPTESGVELKILKKLFSQQEAEIAASLEMMPAKPEAIAKKVNMDPAELEPVLEEMAVKGLIFRYKRKGEAYYMAAQFVVGIWEYHVNDLDEELIRYFNEYVPDLMKTVWERTPTKQLRVIPVSEDIEAETAIMPYDQAEEIIRSQSRISVQPCICRKEHRMIGEGCDYPLEVCLGFGAGAEFYIDNGLGRAVDTDEALEILAKGQEAGLVIQPGNAQKPAFMCMCCGCCCQILSNLKRMDKPADMVHTSYRAEVNPEECTACGVCVDRCHMEAITLNDVAAVDPDRCIGCGVCLPGCEFGAMQLVKKQDYVPPESTIETYMNMARERMSSHA